MSGEGIRSGSRTGQRCDGEWEGAREDKQRSVLQRNRLSQLVHVLAEMLLLQPDAEVGRGVAKGEDGNVGLGGLRVVHLAARGRLVLSHA